MEETEVIIVGAGPAGLALALSLAKFKVHSVILEKDSEITQDPRGVYLTHDSVRILWDLGLGDSLEDIGHGPSTVNFHRSSFVNKPFFGFNLDYDTCWQALPNAVLHIQPRLENAMRKKVTESPFCSLRCGSEVVGKQQEGEYPVITYQDEKGLRRTIRGSFVVGADGKRGVVRKKFLEQSAGIKQVDSTYRYDGTWVAANLKLTVPTQETHPDFPLWGLGFTPEAVYDLFWPKGWHFCTPPGKATACGRFGPHTERMWRYEFEQNDWDDSMDAEKLLLENITPMITRKEDGAGKPFACGEVTYPADCINIIRCRPFRFTHKVVNKWYDDRTILIGDASHVFPPFGGQGIASGLRDAHQLAWRISLLQLSPTSDGAYRDRILGAWARERDQGVKDAAAITDMNGRLCNQGDSFGFWLLRTIFWLLSFISRAFVMTSPVSLAENRGYQCVEGGFFLKKFGGGRRLAQIYLESNRQPPILSDRLISGTETVMTLLIIVRGDYRGPVAEAEAALRTVDLNPSILSEKSLRIFFPNGYSGKCEVEAYYPASAQRLRDLNIDAKPGYDSSNYLRRFDPATKFAIIRPDFFTFALARTGEELVLCLRALSS